MELNKERHECMSVSMTARGHRRLYISMLKRHLVLHGNTTTNAHVEEPLRFQVMKFDSNIRLLKLVKRFEETGKLKDRARAGRLYLKEARAPCIAVEMEAIASEAASGTSSAREAARRLGLPPSSVRNILRRILQLYPYKLQSCHELLPADTAQREAFAKWAFSKMEQDPTWVFNILWTDEAHFSLHGDVNNPN
ncbi:uncharacterized protein TNCV_571421 [Trichonephila clavipes]|nr:uncharacterized protein TNCV_571421 [Trichonephila clavipes]